MNNKALNRTRVPTHLLIPAVVLGLCAWASGGAASFFPPWRPSHGPLGGVWPPLLALLLSLLGIGTMRGLALTLHPFLPARLARFLHPSGPTEKHRFRIEPVDWVFALALALAQYGVLDLYRDFYNPEDQAIGHDNYAFLSTAVAAQSGRWELYMVDKRPLYGILSAAISPFFAGDTIRATVAVSMASMSLVQVPMFLLGRLWGGRTAGLAAAFMLLGTALFYPYAHEVSSYPLYNLVATSTVLAVSWALFHPSARSFLLAGVVMAVLTLTQVKNFTFNLPMIVLLVMSLLVDGRGARIRRSVCMLGPIAAAVGFLMAYPVEFTPLNVLVMHHREEVNYEIPYVWEETTQPKLSSPSPLSPYLPDFLRGGEFEAASGVMLTPPNSDVVAAFPQDGPNPRWEIVRATTIPPTSVRLSHNIKQAATLAPGIGSILFPLVAIGWVWAVLIPATPSRRRWGLPAGWWRAGVLLIPIASCFGSLSLKFNLRYVFHSAPTLYVLVGLAAAGAAHITTRNSGALWRWAAKAAGVTLGISMGLALFIRAPLMPGSVTEQVMENAFFRLPPDSRQLMGKGYRLVSAYLEEHVDEGIPVYDCTPIAMGLYRPLDPRLIRPKNGSERDRLCKKQLSAPTATTPRVLVLTSIPEFFGPEAVMPQHAASAGWTLLYGYDMSVPRELGDPEDLSAIGSGWIAVFTDQPDAMRIAPSMLDGGSPSTTALSADSPTNPNRSAGRPEAGNP